MSVGEASGERFVPEVMGGQLIEAEHQVRYRLAQRFVVDQDVLDAGCGVGWGTCLLYEAGARTVIGIDISPEAVSAASEYDSAVEFIRGDLLDLPFQDDSFDVVTCFEAIEHVEGAERAVAEFARVLRPNGVLLVSSPNPRVYPSGNPFHVREFPPDELASLVARHFPVSTIWRQFNVIASVLHRGDKVTSHQPFASDALSVTELGDGHDPYSLIIASHEPTEELVAHIAMTTSEQLDNLARAGEDVVRRREALKLRQQELDKEIDRVGEAPQEVQMLRGRLARVEAERNRLATLLVDAEQRVAQLSTFAGNGSSSTESRSGRYSVVGAGSSEA